MVKLGETIVLDFTSKDPKTQQAAAASATSVKVYENNTQADMGISITPSTRTGLTGAYFFLLECSTANGFEVGKMYNVYVTVTVGGVTQNKCIATFGITTWGWDDLGDEAFGKWVLDKDLNTLTLYKADGVTVLRTFNLGTAVGDVPAYVTRTPA